MTATAARPWPPLPGDLAGLAQAVQSRLRGIPRLGVAFSGGVDSTLLTALAVRELGTERVVAILGVSPSLARRERAAAHAVAGALGVRLVEVATDEGARAAYVRNGPDRCFHCKDTLFTTIDERLTAPMRLGAIAYGENAQDARRSDRPGAAAASAHRVLRPLADAGLTKADVRALARALGLPVADKPPTPCLASRIPHFEPVTPARLAQVEAAEDALLALGFAEHRVRHHGPVARIEVPLADLPRARRLRDRIAAGARRAGFQRVVLDPAGLQSGAFTRQAMGLGQRAVHD